MHELRANRHLRAVCCSPIDPSWKNTHTYTHKGMGRVWGELHLGVCVCVCLFVWPRCANVSRVVIGVVTVWGGQDVASPICILTKTPTQHT